MTPIFQAPKRFADATRTFIGPVPTWLRIVAFVAVVGWLLTAAATMTGCSADGQAQNHDRIADAADSAADTIDAGLAKLPQDPDAAPVNPDAVRGLLPAEWAAAFDALLASGKDAVASAAEISAELRAVEAANRQSAAAIRAEIDAGADAWSLAVTQAQGVATSINPVLGLGVTVVAGIAGMVRTWRRGKAEGARQVAEIVNAGRHADPVLNNAIVGGQAGDAMKTALANSDPIVAKAVKATKL
jgi:hypothetical protein